MTQALPSGRHHATTIAAVSTKASSRQHGTARVVMVILSHAFNTDRVVPGVKISKFPAVSSVDSGGTLCHPIRRQGGRLLVPVVTKRTRISRQPKVPHHLSGRDCGARRWWHLPALNLLIHETHIVRMSSRAHWSQAPYFAGSRLSSRSERRRCNRHHNRAGRWWCQA